MIHEFKNQAMELLFVCEDENCGKRRKNASFFKALVTQNSTSKSRTKSSENLVDVAFSGSFWSIMFWLCFVRGMAVGSCSTGRYWDFNIPSITSTSRGVSATLS